LFKAKFTALSNKVLFSFISAGVLTAKLHQESISFGQLQQKGQTKRKISVLFFIVLFIIYLNVKWRDA
jgi:hypothetical protein